MSVAITAVDNEGIPSEMITCALCGSDRWIAQARYRDLDFKVPGEWCLVRCDDCGFIYLNPRPALSAFNLIYPRNYVPYQMELTPSTRWLMRKAIITAYEGGKLREIQRCNIPVGSRILDVGCGAGFFLSLLADHGWLAVGVEPNQELVERARRNALDVRLGTLEDARLESEAFDVITLWHALEHDPVPKKTLSRCRELLKPGGVVIIQLPDFDSWEAKAFGNYFWGLDLPRHLNFFTSDTLGKIGLEQGFKVEAIRRTRNPTSWLWSLLRKLGLDWYAEMERNIGKITFGYLLLAPVYYAFSKGDWITASMRKE